MSVEKSNTVLTKMTKMYKHCGAQQGIYVYLEVIHTAVQQKPKQH